MSVPVTNSAQAQAGSGRPSDVSFPALRDARYPVHKIADQLEPYVRVIVEKFHPEKIILFGSYAYGQPNEHSDVDLLIIPRGIASEKESNVEIRHAFWDVPAPPLSFTLLSKTPEEFQEKLAEHFRFTRRSSREGCSCMLRKKTTEKEPADWFAFAGERLRATDVLWSHDDELVALIRESLPQYFSA